VVTGAVIRNNLPASSSPWRSSQRIAAQRTEANETHLRLFAGLQLHALVVDHDERAFALDDGPLLREIKRHDGDVFGEDVLPDIKLGPVRQGKHADGFDRPYARVVDAPELGALVLGIPGVRLGPEGKDALLGAGFLLVAARSAEGRVEAEFVERLLQPLGFHDLGVERGAGVEGIDAAPDTVLIDVDVQLQSEALHRLVAKRDHFPKFPCGIDMEERKRRQRWVERLHRQMKHHRGVLTDRIEHDGVAEFGRHLAHDVDAFRLQPLEMRQA
jgi:hypothetical protein